MLLNARLAESLACLEFLAVCGIMVIYALPVTGEDIADNRAVKYEEHLCLRTSQDVLSKLGGAPGIFTWSNTL